MCEYSVDGFVYVSVQLAIEQANLKRIPYIKVHTTPVNSGSLDDRLKFEYTDYGDQKTFEWMVEDNECKCEPRVRSPDFVYKSEEERLAQLENGW